MRIAVLSDIHGFSLAVDTVLADIDASGPFDEVVVAGDLCEVGPDPRGVLDRLADRPFVILKGNTDDDLATHHPHGRGAFAAEQIGQAGVRYLDGLRFDHRITPPGGTTPDDDLLVVHANPHDLRGRLDPTASDGELREVIGDARFAAIGYGHVHIAGVRDVDGRLLADIAAVGNPKDGDLRCKYGIFTWGVETHAWSVEIRRLPYPLDETTAQIRASDLPEPERTLRILRRASY